MIEEYFKALKTGCAYEKSQLETLHALLNLLAIQAVVAWQLLRLRTIARDDPQRPATHVLSRWEARDPQRGRLSRLEQPACVRRAILGRTNDEAITHGDEIGNQLVDVSLPVHDMDNVKPGELLGHNASTSPPAQRFALGVLLPREVVPVSLPYRASEGFKSEQAERLAPSS